MLQTPSSTTPLTNHNPKSPLTTLLTHGRSLIQLIDDHLNRNSPDKENQNTSNTIRSHSEGLQLSFKGDFGRGVEDMLVLLQSILSHYQQPTSQSREQAGRQGLGSIEALRKVKKEVERISNEINKEKGGKGSLEKECKELTAVLATLMDQCLAKQAQQTCEAESKGFDSSKDSKRSLLTQKIKQAQLQQQQSEQILKTIRMNPKYIIGNLIQQTKTRDRTVPIKPHHLQSQHSQKFSFSQPDCLQLQPQPQPIQHSRSSRILTEMHSHPTHRQKPNRSHNLGCSRCQIY